MVDFQLPNQFSDQLIEFGDVTKVGVEIDQMQDKWKTFYYVCTLSHGTMVSGIESDRVAKIPEFELVSGRKAGKLVAVSRPFFRLL